MTSLHLCGLCDPKNQGDLYHDIPALTAGFSVECKRSDAPTLTPSMRIALTDLKLDELMVVYPGERRYRLAPRVEAVPLAELVGAT